MKKSKKMKVSLILLGSFMVLTFTNAIMVNAKEKGKEMIDKSSIKIDGPYFYELEDNKIKTSYKYEIQKDSLLRYHKELSNFQLGQTIRTKVCVENTSAQVEKFKLITVLEDIDGQKEDILAMSNINELQGNENKDIYVDTKIPDSGNYNFKVFMWDDVNGMKALKDTTILGDGASKLEYKYDGTYNRNNPKIILSWQGNDNAESYDIYVENKVVANVKETSYSLELEPYTPYKISVQARLSDGMLTAHSNTLYFMTEDAVQSQEVRMSQWEDNRFGMFIHWGGYAAFGGVYQGLNASGEEIDYDSAGGGNGAYSEWIKFGAGIPDDTYKSKVEEEFTAENYNPQEWVKVAKDAGMKYIVLTSKHHEGLALFNTAAKNSWSVQDTMARVKLDQLDQKDFLKELIYEAEKEGISVGVYYSQSLDWAQKGSIGWTPQRQSKWSQEEIEKLKSDIIASGVSKEIVDKKIWDILGGAEYKDMQEMTEELILTQVEELMKIGVNVNGKNVGIETLWWDMGQHNYPEFNYDIMKKVVELDPDKKIKMNNRILHEDKYTTMPFDFSTPEQSIPSAPDARYWETCMTMNQNWGYAKNDNNWKPASELINNLSRITSMGGNFLLNVGPKPDGEFPQQATDLLAEVGNWMDVNGESIYETSKNPFLNNIPYGYATQKGNKVYLHVYEQEHLQNLIVPGLKTHPDTIKVITGQNQYQTVSFVRNELYKGYQVTENIAKSNPVSTVIVLEFSGIPEFEKCDLNFPVIQDSKTHHAVFKPGMSTIVGDSLKVENNGENFGQWNNETSYAKWDFIANKAGLYSFKINYTTPLKGAVYVQVKDHNGNLIDEARTKYLPSSEQDGWATYKELTLGSLQIPTSGKYTVELHRSEQDAPDNNECTALVGPLNVKTSELIPLDEYQLERQSISQDILNKNGLRSKASGFVGSEVSYIFTGHIDWKLNVANNGKVAPLVTLATGGNQAKVQLSLLDANGQVVSNQRIETIIKTDDWSLKEISLENTFDLTNISGDYYLQLKVLTGEVNFSKIRFVAGDKLVTNISENIVLDNTNTSQIIEANIPFDYELSNSSLVDIVKDSDKKITVTPKSDVDGKISLIIKSKINSQDTQTISVSILDGGIGISKSTQLKDDKTPVHYSVLKRTGVGITLEQSVKDAVKQEGKGIYKLEVIYKIPVNIKYAYLAVNGWGSGDLIPKEWYKTHVYLDLQQHVDQDVIVKLFDKQDEIIDAHEFMISSISVKKLGGTNEMIKNSTLSSTFIDRLDSWNRGNLSCSLNIQLSAHQTKLMNVATAGKEEKDILIESMTEEYKSYGKLGNWWDINDQFSWSFESKEDANYTLYAKAKKNFNDCPIHVVIKDKDSKEVYNGNFTIIDGVTSYSVINNLSLKKGEYTITVDRIGTIDDQVPDFYGFNLIENKTSTFVDKTIAILDRFKKYKV